MYAIGDAAHAPGTSACAVVGGFELDFASKESSPYAH